MAANLHSASLDRFLTVPKVTYFDDLTKCVMAQIPKCGERQLILSEWFLTRVTCQPNVESHTADLPEYPCPFAVLSGHMVIWADAGVDFALQCKNHQKMKNPSGSNREKTKMTNFSARGPPWIHPGGYLAACDILLWGITCPQTSSSPSHSHLKDPTNWSIIPANTGPSLQTNFLWALWKQWYRQME